MSDALVKQTSVNVKKLVLRKRKEFYLIKMAAFCLLFPKLRAVVATPTPRNHSATPTRHRRHCYL
jgi:hypothetical protein